MVASSLPEASDTDRVGASAVASATVTVKLEVTVDVSPFSPSVEVTETVMMENVEAALATLAQLKDRQLRISIDDFGTGYSSLSYLQRLPIDNVKIDHSFVAHMKSVGESLEIVRSIVTLAHSLGKQVIAEGVETAEQLALLRELGCEYGQGYFFSKPAQMPAAVSVSCSSHKTLSGTRARTRIHASNTGAVIL